MKQILGVVIYLRNQKPRQPKKDYGFGMWNDHDKMTDITGYLRKLRSRNDHNSRDSAYK